MISCKELIAIAKDSKKNIIDEIFKKEFDKYEKFIDEKLIESAKSGKRELIINFNIKDFASFYALMCNYYAYRNNDYQIKAVASTKNGDFIISGDKLERLCERISVFNYETLERMIENVNYFNVITKSLIFSEIKSVKMKWVF